MKALFRTAWRILLEIADQNAYQRHLRFHGLAHSTAEWQRFCDKRFALKYARGKCC